MDRRALVLAALFVLAVILPGCSRESPGPVGVPSPAETAAEPTLAPLPDGFRGEWRGLLPCSDCEGIEVELALDRGDEGRFVLVERYLGSAEAGEYRSEGTWSEDACSVAGEPARCLHLQGPDLRWARYPDGSLAAVDGEGRLIDPDGARLQRL
ncbi:MAG: copper resistance protein NlpE N-terminal domain-containing protein [Lysobacteraceae bacterium]|jgi:uncharacterized lipoprotein NlpE involved in copper resistance|nr:copper resistance protein NlpE N-terminal domain-containing protein [Silanimonas sp.]